MSAGARARGVSCRGAGARARRGALRRPRRHAVFEELTGRRRLRTGCWRWASPPSSSATRTSTTAPRSARSGEALADGRRAARRHRQRRRRRATVPEGPPFHRDAGVALVDAAGVVPDGAVSDRSLLEPAPDGALRRAAVRRRPCVDAFEASWSRGRRRAGGGLRPGPGRSVPAVEPPARRARLAATALRWHRRRSSAELLADRSTRRATRCSWSRPTTAAGEVHLTVAGLRAPDVEPGLLRSGSTRRTGIVTLVDIAPTILDLVGRRPPELDGGPPVRASRRRRVHRRGARRRPRGARRGGSLPRPDGDAGGATFVVLQAALWVGAARRPPTAAAARARSVVALRGARRCSPTSPPPTSPG